LQVSLTADAEQLCGGDPGPALTTSRERLDHDTKLRMAAQEVRHRQIIGRPKLSFSRTIAMPRVFGFDTW
jgi:hypothetical protein